VDRIQHGVCAIESEAVVQKLVEGNVVLDMYLISNLKLRVEGVETMADHPIRQLMDAGVCVTLSTDDTFLFGNSLAEEYYALAQDLGFSRAELIQVAKNGVQASMLSASQRCEIETELDALSTEVASE